MVPFKVDESKTVNTLKAFTGSPDLQPPLGQDKVNEGPIPEGIWWLKQDNLQCIDDLGFWKRITGSRAWPDGIKRWGRYRLKNHINQLANAPGVYLMYTVPEKQPSIDNKN